MPRNAYFLTKPEDSAGGWDIGRAATRDLVNGEYLGLALTRGAPGSRDDTGRTAVSDPVPVAVDETGIHADVRQ